MSQIKDRSLAASGYDKLNWVESYMPILSQIKRQFAEERPFEGKRIAISIHLEAKTAYLATVLRAGGAEVHVTGCNPLSTQDDIAAMLVEEGFEVNAVHGASEAQYLEHLRAALSCCPHVMIDDGGDFTQLLHSDCKAYAKDLIGGCEETTTGIMRLRAREASGALDFPMISVNDADCKHLFDNRYGTGQSTLTAIMQVTNLTIASRTVVVAGYGWCGRGVAMRARGMGARVIVTEIDAVKAIEAVMDGFEVMPMEAAATLGDIFVTVTGCKDVITEAHIAKMKDGAILCNAGHFDVEISKPDLARLCVRSYARKPDIVGYEMADGRTINLLAEGRLVNLAAGLGHPAEIMDMSFAIQAKCLEYLVKNGGSFENKLYAVPREIDLAVAAMKLQALGIALDALTPEQERYINGYAE